MNARLVLATIFASGFLLISATFVNTGKAYAAVESHCDGSTKFLNFPTWYRYLDIGGPNCDIQGPLKADGSGEIDWEQASSRVAVAIIEILLRIATLVAVGFVISGGIRFITSQGEPDNTRAARQSIINALIGLVISLLATAIVAFIANRLSS